MGVPVPRDHLKVSRVLHEDDEFITLEVMKNDTSTFHLQQNADGETIGGDRFLTMFFVHVNEDGVMETWEPWKE